MAGDYFDVPCAQDEYSFGTDDGGYYHTKVMQKGSEKILKLKSKTINNIVVGINYPKNRIRKGFAEMKYKRRFWFF